MSVSSKWSSSKLLFLWVLLWFASSDIYWRWFSTNEENDQIIIENSCDEKGGKQKKKASRTSPKTAGSLPFVSFPSLVTNQSHWGLQGGNITSSCWQPSRLGKNVKRVPESCSRTMSCCRKRLVSQINSWMLIEYEHAFGRRDVRKKEQNTSQTISWSCSLLQETSFCKLFFVFCSIQKTSFLNSPSTD